MIIPYPKDEEIIKRLLERTTFDDITGCLLYNGGKNTNGHCQIRVNGIFKLIHRISASIYLGFDIEDKLFQINHKPECPNKNCWNYNHLYIGTQSDNIQDAIRMETHNQIAKTHCPAGHPYNNENTYLYKGFRHCRTCRNERSKQSREKHGL